MMIICFMITGMLGAILMFCGDMLLYYDPNDFEVSNDAGHKEVLAAVIGVMKSVPKKRLYAGGMIGPIASFLYCAGFYHFVLISETKLVAAIAFGFCSLGIIIGGAFHSHCAYLGLLGDDKYEEAREIAIKYFYTIATPSYIFEGIGYVIMIVLVLLGYTRLPGWTVLVSPGILYMLKPLVRRLPKGIRVIVSGGWGNLISVIYYAIAIACVLAA